MITHSGKGTGKGSFGVQAAIITNDPINPPVSIILHIHKMPWRSPHLKFCSAKKFASVNLSKNIAHCLPPQNSTRWKVGRSMQATVECNKKAIIFKHSAHGHYCNTHTSSSNCSVWGVGVGGGGQSHPGRLKALFALDQKMESCSGRCGSTLVFFSTAVLLGSLLQL